MTNFDEVISYWNYCRCDHKIIKSAVISASTSTADDITNFIFSFAIISIDPFISFPSTIKIAIVEAGPFD